MFSAPGPKPRSSDIVGPYRPQVGALALLIEVNGAGAWAGVRDG
jgi:hypothetical protein